jgi:hypothetical protein
MKRIILVLTAALLLAAMTVAVAPAMAQEQKKEETKMEEKKGDDKDKMKEEKDLPKSGGLPINASLLGLGAGVLLGGGGLFAVRIARQDRR